MPISDYLRDLRALVGTRLLLLPGVAAVIPDPAGRILVERRADNGAWGLPAGAIDPGESPAGAVVREVHEETGLDVVPERILGVFGGPRGHSRYPNGDEAEYTVIVFLCRIVGGTLAPLDGEALDLRFVPAAQAAAHMPTYPAALFTYDGATALFDP